MLIENLKQYIGMQRTALIIVNKAENINKYYIIQLEKTKEHNFRITFKYGKRGDNPRIIKKIENTYPSACTTYNNKISYLKTKRDYAEVEFMDIMMNDTSEFYNYDELEIIP